MLTYLTESSFQLLSQSYDQHLIVAARLVSVKLVRLLRVSSASNVSLVALNSEGAGCGFWMGFYYSRCVRALATNGYHQIESQQKYLDDRQVTGVPDGPSSIKPE